MTREWMEQAARIERAFIEIESMVFNLGRNVPIEGIVDRAKRGRKEAKRLWKSISAQAAAECGWQK